MDAFDTSSFDAERGAFPVGDAQPVAGHSLTADLYRVKLYGKWHFLKKLKPELAGNPAYVAAFEKEFDIGFNLDHPNIVRYVSVGDDGTAPYLLTQYVDGLTLAEFVSKNPGYFKNKAHFRAFVAQVLSAVGYMHSRQVLHLDLKPGNVMLTNVDRQVKIVDLGFSYSDLYQHDTAGYTATFAAPEQLAGLAYLVNQGHTFQGKSISLTNDIDLSGLKWEPIGTTDLAFRGTFDGGGYEIHNLQCEIISDQTFVAGLFGQIEQATLSNIVLADDCTVTGEGLFYAGGIVAYAYLSNIISCVNRAGITVEGPRGHVGGIAGYLVSSEIDRCENQGLVHAEVKNTSMYTNYFAYAGGIAGYVWADEQEISVILNSCNSAAVTVDGVPLYSSYVGGIAGYAGGYTVAVWNNYNTADISLNGTGYAGGIVVLYVFSILLTSGEGDRAEKLKRSRFLPGIAATIVGAIIVLFITLKHQFLATTDVKPIEVNISTIGQHLLSSDKFGYLLPFEAVSILLLACIVGGLLIARKR